MTKEGLLAQAERAEGIAAQTADPELKKNLLNAARDYRREARTETCRPDPQWRLPREISEAGFRVITTKRSAKR